MTSLREGFQFGMRESLQSTEDTEIILPRFTPEQEKLVLFLLGSDESIPEDFQGLEMVLKSIQSFVQGRSSNQIQEAKLALKVLNSCISTKFYSNTEEVEDFQENILFILQACYRLGIEAKNYLQLSQSQQVAKLNLFEFITQLSNQFSKKVERYFSQDKCFINPLENPDLEKLAQLSISFLLSFQKESKLNYQNELFIPCLAIILGFPDSCFKSKKEKVQAMYCLAFKLVSLYEDKKMAKNVSKFHIGFILSAIKYNVNRTEIDLSLNEVKNEFLYYKSVGFWEQKTDKRESKVVLELKIPLLNLNLTQIKGAELLPDLVAGAIKDVYQNKSQKKLIVSLDGATPMSHQPTSIDKQVEEVIIKSFDKCVCVFWDERLPTNVKESIKLEVLHTGVPNVYFLDAEEFNSLSDSLGEVIIQVADHHPLNSSIVNPDNKLEKVLSRYELKSTLQIIFHKILAYFDGLISEKEMLELETNLLIGAPDPDTAMPSMFILIFRLQMYVFNTLFQKLNQLYPESQTTEDFWEKQISAILREFTETEGIKYRFESSNWNIISDFYFKNISKFMTDLESGISQTEYREQRNRFCSQQWESLSEMVEIISTMDITCGAGTSNLVHEFSEKYITDNLVQKSRNKLASNYEIDLKHQLSIRLFVLIHNILRNLQLNFGNQVNSIGDKSVTITVFFRAMAKFLELTEAIKDEQKLEKIVSNLLKSSDTIIPTPKESNIVSVKSRNSSPYANAILVSTIGMETVVAFQGGNASGRFGKYNYTISANPSEPIESSMVTGHTIEMLNALLKHMFGLGINYSVFGPGTQVTGNRNSGFVLNFSKVNYYIRIIDLLSPMFSTHKTEVLQNSISFKEIWKYFQNKPEIFIEFTARTVLNKWTGNPAQICVHYISETKGEKWMEENWYIHNSADPYFKNNSSSERYNESCRKLMNILLDRYDHSFRSFQSDLYNLIGNNLQNFDYTELSDKLSGNVTPSVVIGMISLREYANNIHTRSLDEMIENLR